MNRPAVRWTVTLVWTALVLYLMLAPSGQGTPVSTLSHSTGGTARTDANGHFLLFASLTLLWFWTLTLQLSTRRAALLAAVIGITLGLSLEAAQQVIAARGSSLLDYSANMAGVGLATLAGVFIQRQQR